MLRKESRKIIVVEVLKVNEESLKIEWREFKEEEKNERIEFSLIK